MTAQQNGIFPALFPKNAARMEQQDENWWYKEDGGRICGPFSLEALRALCLAGKIHPETAVSGNAVPWSAAATIPELAFDCLVLQPQPDGSLCVSGPFPEAFLSDPEIRASLPGDALLFTRRGRISSHTPARNEEKTNADMETRPIEAEIERQAAQPAPSNPAALLEEQLRLELNRMAAARHAQTPSAPPLSRRSSHHSLFSLFNR